MGRSRSRSRSRSISPVRRKRAKERDRSKKRKHRNRSVSREKRRRSGSRERDSRDGRAGGSWIGSSHRSENRAITRSRSKSRSYERPFPSSSSSKSKNNPSIKETGSLEGKSHEDLEMMKVMGFCGFDTTKNKKVDGNDPGAVHVILKRKYRQYMNRKGGFNRPLDFVA